MKLAVTLLHSPALCYFTNTKNNGSIIKSKKKNYNSESLPECRCALVRCCRLKVRIDHSNGAKTRTAQAALSFPLVYSLVCEIPGWNTAVQLEREDNLDTLDVPRCIFVQMASRCEVCARIRGVLKLNVKQPGWISISQSDGASLCQKTLDCRHQMGVSCSSKPAGSNISFS